MKLRGRPRPEQEASASESGPRCPYCHDEVVQGAELAQGCPWCMAWSHAECWSEAQERCGACDHSARERLDRPFAKPPRKSLDDEISGGWLARDDGWSLLLSVLVLLPILPLSVAAKTLHRFASALFAGWRRG